MANKLKTYIVTWPDKAVSVIRVKDNDARRLFQEIDAIGPPQDADVAEIPEYACSWDSEQGWIDVEGEWPLFSKPFAKEGPYYGIAGEENQ